MSDDLTQLPAPPLHGGARAWIVWAAEAGATVFLPLGGMAVRNWMKGRKEHRREVLTRLEKLEQSVLKEDVFTTSMDTMNQNSLLVRDGLNGLKESVNHLTKRLDRHIDAGSSGGSHGN